jgi:hypothetical protein
MYVSVDEVRSTVGVTDTDIMSDAVIEQSIKFAEDEVDRWTNTTYYPNLSQGTATAVTDDTLEDSTQSWTVNQYSDYAVYIYSGTGEGQIRGIASNTADTLTLDSDWTTNPDTTSKYYITYNNKVSDKYDGFDKTDLHLRKFPVVQVDSLTINDTAITSSDYFFYKDIGKLSLKNTSPELLFGTGNTEEDRQGVIITYWYGVLAENRRGLVDIPQHIKRFCTVVAGLKALTYQVGGTYDTPSTWSLPEMSSSLGQAYQNIRMGPIEGLLKELEDLRKYTVGRNLYIE